ncbi:hypothetical protein ACFLX2_00395 [Candidatus Dependentiae bacterium]
MSWLTSAADFILSEWLWNVTWGWYHIPVNIFVLLFLLKFFGGVRIVPAVLISVFSQIFSFFFFSAIVVVGPMYAFGLKFVPYDCYAHTPTHPLVICFSLGGIYFILHLAFFAIVNTFYAINLKLMTLIAIVANILSALLVYRFWSYNFL